MKDGYRGDRRALPQLIRGLVVLTNYYIDQHSLSKGDELLDPPRFLVPRPKASSQEDSDTADGTSVSSVESSVPSSTASPTTKTIPSQKKVRN